MLPSIATRWWERHADAVARIVVGCDLPPRWPDSPFTCDASADAGTLLREAAIRVGDGGVAAPAHLVDAVGRVTGVDVRHARVHTGRLAAKITTSLGCRAITHRGHVFLAPGEFRPGTVAGDALLAHELTHVAQQAAHPAAPSVQAKFGFEFELLLPVTSGPPGAIATPSYSQVPKPRALQGQTTMSPVVGEYWDRSGSQGVKLFSVEVDHNSSMNHHKPDGWPKDEDMTVLEIVTEPFDETTATKEVVVDVIDRIARWAEHVVALTEDEGRKPVTELGLDPLATAGGAPPNFIGPVPGARQGTAVSADAYVQQSMGVRLDFVTQEFRRWAPTQDKYTAAWCKHLWAAGQEGTPAYTTKALAKVPTATGRGAVELRGLFALMRYYAGVWNDATLRSAKLSKNQVGIFYYKTQLSTVRNDLAGKYPDIGKALDDPGTRKTIIDALGIPPARKEWADEVLTGTKDSFFIESVNPYSSELLATRLGPPQNSSVGVVIENRELRIVEPPPQQGRFGVSSTARYAANSWAKMAGDLYDRQAEQHGT
jgi:hypothetical protein